MPCVISDAVMTDVVAHAAAAYPNECCGYVAEVVHRCPNIATAARMEFEFAAEELLRFARAFDGDHAPTVVYHSHPDGRAMMSARDREVALAGDRPAHPVEHLIIATRAGGEFAEAALFAWSATARDFLEVQRWPHSS